MEYRTPTTNQTDPPQHCCYVDPDGDDCGADATWTLTTGHGIEDNTQSCHRHVTDLLGGDPLLNIESIGLPSVDTLDIVFDGPPGHESGRFVEVEGFIGAEPGYVGPRGVRAGTWIQDGDLWRLRIHVPGGMLVG